MKEKELTKLLSEETTLNPKEAEMSIYQLFKSEADGSFFRICRNEGSDCESPI
jgi:hypothetical protein